ncbi:MAG: NAD(P)H-binding protein [Jiangellaceae bacterium]
MTGAAGKTGLAVTRAATEAGLRVRALVRPGSAAGAVRAAGAHEVAVADLDGGVGMLDALAGCSAAYLIAPNVHLSEPSLVARVLAAAAETGTERVVYHSVLHPYAPEMPHHLGKAVSEDLVRRSGLSWTVLQPCAYVQNLVTVPQPDEIVVPYSLTSAFSMVDLRDVAAAAAIVLAEPGHHGATYELAGPEQVSVARLASLLGIEARQITVEEWRSSAGANLPQEARDALAAMFAYYDRHGLVGNPNVLTWLLGRPPRTVADVIGRGAGNAAR